MTLYVDEEHFCDISAGAGKMVFGEREEKKSDGEQKQVCTSHTGCWW